MHFFISMQANLTPPRTCTIILCKEEVNGFYGLERPIGEMKQIVDVRFITAATKSEDEALNIPERLRGKLCPILVLEPLEGLLLALSYIINL